MSAASSHDRRLVEDEHARHLQARLGAYVVVFRDPNGRQRKRSARTLAEARDLKAALTADVRRGEYRALSRVSFADYAAEWIESYQGRTSRGIRPETLADYRTDLERDAVPFFGRMQLAAIEPRDVKRFAAQLAARGLAPGSVRNLLAPVRALLATAHEDGLIRGNPAAGLRIVQRAEGEHDESTAKALTEDELRALLAEIPDEWRMFFELLAHTGFGSARQSRSRGPTSIRQAPAARAPAALPWSLRRAEVPLRSPCCAAHGGTLTGSLAASGNGTR